MTTYGTTARVVKAENSTDDSQPSVYELREHIDSLKIGHGRLLAEVERLRAALAAAKIPHLIVDEDSWYSCLLAKNEDGEWASYYDLQDGERRRCTCGADKHNAAIDAALEPSRG